MDAQAPPPPPRCPLDRSAGGAVLLEARELRRQGGGQACAAGRLCFLLSVGCGCLFFPLVLAVGGSGRGSSASSRSSRRRRCRRLGFWRLLRAFAALLLRHPLVLLLEGVDDLPSGLGLLAGHARDEEAAGAQRDGVALFFFFFEGVECEFFLRKAADHPLPLSPLSLSLPLFFCRFETHRALGEILGSLVGVSGGASCTAAAERALVASAHSFLPRVRVGGQMGDEKKKKSVFSSG